MTFVFDNKIAVKSLLNIFAYLVSHHGLLL